MQDELAQCRITYRHVVHRFVGGEVLFRFDPERRGEVWRRGKCLWRLEPALMAIYEAALTRHFLTQAPDESWQLVDNDGRR